MRRRRRRYRKRKRSLRKTRFVAHFSPIAVMAQSHSGVNIVCAHHPIYAREYP